jgi:uncharacterized membrane protein YoaK (UPF0700 family)
MFRQGKPRAFIHNMRLASMLSFVAGIVNISGVLSINTLTTNVTGHFAFFAEDFVKGNYQMALAYISYILFFLLGAFFCSLSVEFTLRTAPGHAHTLPMVVEIAMLVSIAIVFGQTISDSHWVARALLFAMGLQNALVTKISQATVRTTHLTGLFTDLGIELSQLFFYREQNETKKLSRSIYLRFAIIVFFFFGGVVGGFLYRDFELRTLYFAAASLLVALAYDIIRLGFHRYLRKLK